MLNTNLQTQTSSVLHNDTVSSYSTSKVQEKTQLSRSRCMNSLREVKSQFKFLTETLQDFGTMPIFKRTFSQDLDLLEQHLTKNILSQTDCKTILTKLKTTFENAFNSEFKERMQKYTRFNAQSFQDAMISLNVDSLKVDLVIIKNTCSKKEDSNSETTSSKSEKESSLDYATKYVHAIKYKISKAKERCMAYFRSLDSHLQVLSKEDLKGTRIEHGFKRAFMSLFVQDDNTFTSTMFLNVDQLHKQLDKDEFQEDGSMATFWVINRQFPKFIDSKFSLDYDSQMTEKYFVEYTRIEIKQFKDTLLQHMGNVRKSVAERMCHHRQYDRRLNKRQMQMQKSMIDTGKAVNANLVITKSSRTESEVKDNSNIRPIYDEDIRPIFDEEPMAEVQLTAECNIFAIGQQHTEQPEIINEGRVDQSKTIEQKTSLLANNADLKAQIQKKVSLNKTSVMYEKTSSRSDLRWKPTGRIFKIVGLRWVPTGKILASCTSKDDSESTHGSNVDIPNIHICKQTLDLSAGTSINVQKEQGFDLSAVDSKLISKMTFEHNGSSLARQCQRSSYSRYDRSSAVTPADVSNKSQQQPDSTSSTSTLATIVTADGNFDVAQDDQESQIKMIQVKEMMQDKDLKNSKSKDKGSRSRSQSMNEQSHYKQEKTKTRPKKASSNVISSTLGRLKSKQSTSYKKLSEYKECHIKDQVFLFLNRELRRSHSGGV
ncbi:hypothetical protein Tco_1020385 [Tanacetum coccineum]|uniref:Uncharacterized protein n=1 Tax=Tanacetum coccineum TaxID=301880 RepID=A0ABQ5G062_9ASTR